MPTPHPKIETQEKYISRCIPTVLKEGTTKDPKQAAAICFSMWEKATKKKSGAEILAHALKNMKKVD